ncbi:SDR family oxidoreductase [Rhizosaccharibacter radicis]|uniref:SDR family oxidoreductase n=1 Tax=Rhizosaccharibacter radicis TaxID=2782605 RepID=A0ABT1VW55_9PROT|nr:SDR family oxidoreductase [Acetobacteraceae bacterium KSS12]
MSGKILVLGATGTIGRPLVAGLLARGEPVRAASRGGQSVGDAEGQVFDFTNPDTIAPAFDGVDRVYVLLPAGYTAVQDLLLPIVAEAARRDVKIVFQSAIAADADDSNPYRQVELAIEKSGSPFVILRPNWFSDNFHTFWKQGLDHGSIALPAGDSKTSFIDARDIAESAVAVLNSSEFDGRAIDLNGPEALTYTQAAAILSDVIGKPIHYTAISEQAFIDMLKSAGVPGESAALMASIFHPVREGRTGTLTDDVEVLTGRAPRTLKTYAVDNAALLTRDVPRGV